MGKEILERIVKCKYCDGSEECEYWQDGLSGDWYLEVRGEWDEAEGDWVYDKLWGVEYCQYCGRKLDEARTV